MAAPPSPRPPKAQTRGGDAPLSVFLDTDLGTRLALLVAPDTTIRRLKSQVAAEHAAAFPDIGPVSVKSFQVSRQGALYHLSESMTVTGAFTRVKGGCFLHVKMAEAAVAMCFCKGTPEIDGRRTSEGHVGIHVEKHVRKLPAVTPEVANDGLTHRLGGGHATAVLNNAHAHDAGALLAPSSQLDTEIKNETECLASDADIYKLSKQTNISHVVEADAKEDILYGDQNRDFDGDVSDNKQIMIDEDILGQAHDVEDISRGKERKKAKRTDCVNISATDLRITDEPDTIDINKSIRAPSKTNPTHGKNSNTSSVQEVNANIREDSFRIKTPGTVGKKKKRKRSQLAPSESISGQKTTKLPTGVVGLSKSGTDAYEVDLTNRDGGKATSSVLLLSSEPNDENRGGKHVQFVNNAQASTDLTSVQGNFDHVHYGDRNPSIGIAINSTAEVQACDETAAEGSIGPWDGGEKYEETKIDKYNEGCHNGDIAETSNMEKGDKNIDALEERPVNVNKKVKSVDMASMDTAADKEILGHTENAGKPDKDYTEREILHGPSVGPISDNVQQGNSNIIENPHGDGKRKKKKRRRSESLKDADPNQDQTKSSEHVTNGSSIHHINSAPLDAKQKTQSGVEGATVSDKKFGESLHMAATNMIDEVLADLQSRDSLTKELSEDLLTGKIHLDSNMNALELPASTGNKVGNYAALPSKYPEAIHSDATVRSPKKPHGKQLNILPAMIDSSHHSFGIPEEGADAKLKESDTLRFSGEASDLKDAFTGDVVEQDNDEPRSTKRQKKKKVKNVPTDKTTQSLDEQVNQVARNEMEGVNTSIQADLVQGGSVIDTPMETVAKVQQKGKKASKTRTPKIPEANHSTHTAKDSQDENAVDTTGTHDNENASGYPTESPVVQVEPATLKSPIPSARKERKKPLLPAMIDSSLHSFGIPEEGADAKLKESDTLRFSGEASDLKDVFTGDIVEQDNDKPKSTKRQRKKVKNVPTDKTIQSLDEQVNQVAREEMEGVNASIQADLVQGGSMIDTPMETVAKVQQKGKKASKTRTPKIPQANHSTHTAKNSQDENAVGNTGTHDNENASGYPTESPVVQVEPATLRSPIPSARKERKKPLLPAMIESSHHSFGIPEEGADAKLKESDTLRFSGEASDLKDVFTGDVVEQDNDKPKSTKRQRKKVKNVPTDKTTQSLDEQVNQVAREEMEGVNASIQADLVQGGSVIDTPMETIAKVQQKGKKASKTRTPKIPEANHSTHTAKDSQDENAVGNTGTHDNENASGYPTESPEVQVEPATLKSPIPSARKERKKPLQTKLQRVDSAMEHDPSADLVHFSAEKDLVSPKSSGNAVEANNCILAHPASEKISFIDHFSLGKMNDRLVSAENIQSNEDEITEAKNKKNNSSSTEPNDLLESLLPEKISLTDHFGTTGVVVPSAKAENMNSEYDNVKSSKEKRKKKKKTNSEGLANNKENLDGDHQGTVIGTQDSLYSVVQKGRVGQDNGNENNKVTQDVSIMRQEPGDAPFDRTTDSQDNLPINKDNAKISKELWKSTSQKKAYVSNIVKSFALSPAASSDSTEGTPQIANRFRLAVRKVPKQEYEQPNAKSKEETRKVGSGAIFSGIISEESDDAMDTKGEKAALEKSSENLSASANSGISSKAYYESDMSDDDGALSLSQKSLRSRQISSILRGSSSYKKAKQKQAELLDDDIEVPDSQPADDLWG